MSARLPDRPPPTPTWVKALLIVLAVIAAVAVVHLLVNGAGGHGLGMHG